VRALDLGAPRHAAAAGAPVQLEARLDGRRAVLRPAGGGCQLAFHLQPGNYNTDSLIGVLGQLRRFLGGQKATLLWDGLPTHRSTKMAAFIATQRHWLVAERLPAYAPELNPVEGLWSNLKARAASWPTCALRPLPG
jgi:DDE superfamily endonuclease